MHFELLDHPADIGFRAHGRDLPELFAASAFALVSLILDPANIEPKQKISLTAQGIDHESLLVNWLNEVLYAVDARRLALAIFEISNLTGTHLGGTASGEPRDPVKHPARLIVKAVTYHQLKIARADREWIAEVYVDV